MFRTSSMLVSGLLSATLVSAAFAAPAKDAKPAAAVQGAKYDAGSYNIDQAHSKVGFEIPHLVISSVEGRFNKFDGVIVLDKDFQKSTFKSSVDVGSIDTGEKKRDDHLLSPDFFDAKKFASMTFVSSEVKGTPEGFKLTGDLTIKGVTKKVTFDSKFLGQVKDGYGNQKVAFHGTTKINRKDFGLTWSQAVEAGPIVGDTLEIVLSIQAGKPAK